MGREGASFNVREKQSILGLGFRTLDSRHRDQRGIVVRRLPRNVGDKPRACTGTPVDELAASFAAVAS